MRHRKSGRHLNRTTAHREAMFRNMASSLFQHEVIKTTLPKAKELRRFAEPLITLAKQDSVANRRLAFSRLHDKGMVKKLFEKLGPLFSERPGGYVRILKCGYRPGDNAPMAYVELVEHTAADAVIVEEPSSKAVPVAEADIEDAAVVEETAAADDSVTDEDTTK